MRAFIRLYVIFVPIGQGERGRKWKAASVRQRLPGEEEVLEAWNRATPRRAVRQFEPAAPGLHIQALRPGPSGISPEDTGGLLG
ncbi:unnamed protein product [Lota lota]